MSTSKRKQVDPRGDALARSAASSAAFPELAERLRLRAATVVPSAGDVKIVDCRFGVRPMPRDGQSIAGRIPGLADAWVIATHSGITLGPLLGRLIPDEIVHGRPSVTLAPFRPERFS
jgi:glycine/D-amino acid oxidase-like deaminating enzyme